MLGRDGGEEYATRYDRRPGIKDANLLDSQRRKIDLCTMRVQEETS